MIQLKILISFTELTPF